MIRNVGELKRCTIGATDGDIGQIKEVYFDDKSWVIRYLVVDTGHWLLGRKVLISPYAVRSIQWAHRSVDVELTRQQVKDSPDIHTDKPASRQHEEAYFAYYGYPYYWAGPNIWGASAYPIIPPPISPEALGNGASMATPNGPAAPRVDLHLRSSNEVAGYHIEAADGSVGHIENFLFDDESWTIRYIAVDTRNWWPGKHVLIAPQWIDDVSWSDRKAYVHVTRAAVKASPPYDPALSLAADYEAALYRHYGRSLKS